MDLATGTVLDRYTVVGRLGEGGMSVVYKVRHNTLGSLHALKVLTLSSPGLRDRIVLEGQVQASLRHPNIVPVTDVIDISGTPGLVMEFVEGPDLDGLLRAHSLSYVQVDALARDIIGAVAAAHAKGLVHRDLKPANVLLMVAEDRLVPKITDFGLAKVLVAEGGKKSGHTRTGAVMGTPHYMAPEQVRDAKHVGPQADVFSLGAILYEMITRKRAFDGSDLYEIFTAVAEGRYTPIRELAPDLPTRMETAITAALRVDPAVRARDCRELLALWNDTLPADVPAAPPSGPWSGELLASAHALSGGGASAPAEPVGAPSPLSVGLEGSLRPSDDAPPKSRATSPPARSRANTTSRTLSSTSPPSALALGVLVGGGGAAVTGIAVVVGVLAAAVGGWVWLTSPPELAAVADPARIEADARVGVDGSDPNAAAEPGKASAPERDGSTSPSPSPSAEPRPSPSPSSSSPGGRSEPDRDGPPIAVVSPPGASEDRPAGVSAGGVPADLDPATTRANAREETMLDKYRPDPGATGVIAKVMERDPVMNVRAVASDILKYRVRNDIDRSGGIGVATWGAQHAEPPASRIRCMRILGEYGDASAGAILAAQIGDPNADIREAAAEFCHVWLERNPGAADIADKCVLPTRSLGDKIGDGVDKLKQLTGAGAEN